MNNNTFDHDYFDNLLDYPSKKLYFELFVCKIEKLNLYYHMNSFYSITKIRELFDNHKLFIKEWLRDPNKKSYSSIYYYPYSDILNHELDPDQDPDDPNNLNIFTGYNLSIKQVDHQDNILDFYDYLLDNTVDHNIEHKNFLYKYFASIIQKPNTRLNHPLVFVSNVDNNKNNQQFVFLDAIINILNPENIACKTIDSFSSKYHNFFGKILAIIQDNNFNNYFNWKKYAHKINSKSSIKFYNTYQTNYTNLIFTSNYPDRVKYNKLDHVFFLDNNYFNYMTDEEYSRVTSYLSSNIFIYSLYHKLTSIII